MNDDLGRNEGVTSTTEPAPRLAPEQGRGREPQPPTEVIPFLKAYAREKPDVAALWCFGIGFVIGWKLKPW